MFLKHWEIKDILYFTLLGPLHLNFFLVIDKVYYFSIVQLGDIYWTPLHGRHCAFYRHINKKEMVPDLKPKSLMGKIIKKIKFNMIGAIWEVRAAHAESIGEGHTSIQVIL